MMGFTRHDFHKLCISSCFIWVLFVSMQKSLALIRITAPGIGMLRRYSHGCLINYHESFALFGRQLNLAKQYHCTHFEVLKLLSIHTHISWSSTNGSPAFVSLRDAPWAGTVTSSHVTYKVRNKAWQVDKVRYIFTPSPLLSINLKRTERRKIFEGSKWKQQTQTTKYIAQHGNQTCDTLVNGL